METNAVHTQTHTHTQWMLLAIERETYLPCHWLLWVNSSNFPHTSICRRGQDRVLLYLRIVVCHPMQIYISFVKSCLVSRRSTHTLTHTSHINAFIQRERERAKKDLWKKVHIAVQWTGNVCWRKQNKIKPLIWIGCGSKHFSSLQRCNLVVCSACRHPQTTGWFTDEEVGRNLKEIGRHVWYGWVV